MAMALSDKIFKYRVGRSRAYQIFAYADEVPALPVKPEHIPGMDATDIFAPGSIIYVTAKGAAKVLMAGTDGLFVVQ